MPTGPLQSILYRSLPKVAAQEKIEVASSLLQELVNHATNALARCAASASGGQDEDLAVLALYRHIIEMTDGIEVLISQACPSPTIPLLRSSFEALLSIEYIVKEEQLYAQRALAWLVGYVHQRLAQYDRLDPSTTRGQQFRKALQSDKIAAGISLPPVKQVHEAQANLQSFLKQPHIQPIESEFNQYSKWYQLFDGPANRCDLAKHLGRGAQYEWLYRIWSRNVHAQDLLGLLEGTDQETATIGRLRDPATIGQTVSFAAAFMLNATRLVVGKFRPGEDLSRWYKREVMNRLRWIRTR